MDKEMAMVHIVQKDMAATKETGDYNAGKANVGTGPYKFVEWVQGERVVFEANPDYWGPKPKWSKLTFRPIKSDPSRLAALLSGSVDIIDYVPTNDLDSLRKNPKVALTEYPSNRVIYFWPDQSRYDSPFVKTNDGKPAVPNPLRDIKVREAISLAINRKAIVDRVMSGAGIEAEQMSPEFIFGSNPALPKLKYDPERAKKLLAEAGWPDGFQLTIHGPNDRYVNDEKVSETVAQMLTKIGIKSNVVVQPKATYFGKTRSGGEMGMPAYSFFMMGSGSNLGDGGSQLQFSHHAYYPLKNMGVGNRGRYNNMRVDAYMSMQMEETNVEKRREQIQKGVAIVMKDWGFIPTHYQKNIWAHRPDLVYAGHTNEKTKAMLVSKKK
jgi:peptide/nickel transport system substrate-binding protein